MKPRRAPLVWAAAIPALGVMLWLLWELRGEPSPERGPAPLTAHVERAETTPEAPLPSEVVAPTAQASLAERTLAAVETAPSADTPDNTRPWVEGIVVHAGGEGTLAGIDLHVYAPVEPEHGDIGPDSTQWIATGRSGGDGRFELPRSLIPASWYSGSVPHLAVLQVDAPGFARFRTPFPPLGEEPAKILVALEPAAVLLGRIVRAESGPLPGASVMFEVQLPKPPEGGTSTDGPSPVELMKVRGGTSDALGRFRVELWDSPLNTIRGPVEAIRIHITHGDFGESRVTLSAAALADLRTARGQRDVDVGDILLDALDWSSVEALPAVIGQLVDPDGAAIRRHNLRILGEDKIRRDKPVVRRVTTDEEGRFTAAGLYGERMLVHSTHEGVRAALEQGEGVEVKFEAGKPVQIVWPMHRVRPRLLDRYGAPIEGASLRLVSKGDSQSTAATLRDGIAQDFYAPPGETVQILATLALGQVVRATVHVPDRPYLTTVDLVRDDARPGTLRLTLDPPLAVSPAMSVAQALAQGGAHGIALQFSDAETGVGLSVGRENPEVLGPGRADVTLAPGSYRLQLARLPKGYAPLRDPPRFVIASGEALELTVQVERSAMLHLVPLDPPAAGLLGGPIDVGELMRRKGALEEVSEPAPGSPAPLLVWNPAATVREGPYRARAEELPAGRYTLRWRWKDGEQWMGEIQLEPGAHARVELAGPAAAEASVGHRWLSLRRE